MYKEYSYALCHTQHHGYDDGGIVKLLNHINAKKRVRKQRKKFHFFLLFKQQKLTFYFYVEKRKKRRELGEVSDGAVKERK